ncbi:uncharacterized protein LOC115981550 isoform X3 [Quercus lobata]|uniref:uncharacterized protein LOC115981550 isoform X3 n=1 Tax=Quercus lobata TaxID=97700 RepID=UPI0012477500|nr:uncharacterized protein LOC115981550 isoform X3 [Quercus lobata]
MDTLGVIATVIVVVATAVATQIGESIRQWLIENVVDPFGQFLIEKLVKPVGQWLGYSFHYSSNIDNMKEQAEKLGELRERVKNSVDAGIGNCGENKADVNRWLENVDVIMGKVRKVVEDEAKAKIKCSYGICLNLKLRHELSKKAKKIAKDIDEVLENGGVGKVCNMDYMSFNSRMPTLNGLTVALGNVNINMIGVWGMPGAGKTTLVREVVWQAKNEKLFDKVAMATVTQSPDLRQIQGEIADMLDLKFDDVETVPGRATRLRERVERNKKVLVILDDIWNKLDLEAIGIPCNGCKILLTSRDRDILSCDMNTQENFELDVLPQHEAWSLFEKMVGDSLKDSNLRSIATQVAEVCAGLPLALVTVATALKNKSLFEWKDALQQLRRPSPVHLTRMQDSIYSKIELSYKHLGSPVVKCFFLLCSQMGPTIFYMDLVKYCFGLCLFPGILTLEEARNKVYTLVRSLKDSCLLLEDPRTSNYVRMHDLVRDVILIAKAENVFSMRDDDPVKWPDEDALKMCTSISVCSRDIHELPGGLLCPKLKFLYVHGRDRDFKISETFFKGMRELKVLDLTKMRLSSLPSSITLLANLQTLCLDQCVLKDIAVIGELKNLEILSLLSSKLTHLPQEIGLLTHLRLLDLSDCTILEVIPPNVLSNLIQLEELYVGNSFTQWEVEGLNNERASLAELKHLSPLTTLEVHIPYANMLPKDLLFEKLQRYKIFVGDAWDWSDKHENSRALKLKLNTSFHLERGIKMLLNGIENLCLDELKGVKSVIYELDMTGFQQLKHLHVQNNDEIKYIINSRRMVMSNVVFPVLETLSLKNMINLEEICHGQIPSASFRNLSIMKVEHCQKLKFIFSSTIAKGLPQLQELVIQECSIMGAIIIKEEGEIEDRDMILLPQLRHLELHQLPKLVSFLSTQKSVINDAGEIIPECELDFHMPILQEQVLLPNLEPRFQNLFFLNLKGSGNLKYLLSSTTARSMVQLKFLYIDDCKVMEEILLAEDLGEEQIIPEVLFPRLEGLLLKDLPVLKRFCMGSKIKFPFLKSMVIYQCPKLESFIFKPVSSKEMNSKEISHTAMQPLFNEKAEFPNLESLKICHMPNLKIIWHDKFAPGSFTKLQLMMVEFCESLMNIFQVNMLSRFQSMETLVVDDCDSLEEIFELQGQEVTETHAVTVTQLKKLYIRRLPKLKRVWNKDPQGMFSFPNLQKIQALKCESLKSLFPTSVAKCIPRLEDLEIAKCGIEEIIEQEEGAKEDARFVFPKLTLVILRKLSKLKWFYRGVHTLEWPLLKTLEVSGSNEIQIFASKNYRIQEQDEQIQLETSIQQPLFLVEEVAFPSLETLSLDELKGVKSVIYELDMTGFQQLKHLHVQNSVEIKYIINSRRMVMSNVVFPVLETLSLKNMINLEEICHGQIPSASFRNLSIMKVEHCQKLKFIFSSTIAKGLPQLQELVIQECSIMGAIIIKEEGEIDDSDMILFPRLRHLELHQLPKLMSFLNTQKSVINDAGEIIPECELDFHMPILQEQVVFPNLETLELSSVHSEEILLHNQHWPTSSFKSTNIQTESRFKNLCNLKVKGSGNLKYLLSSSTATFMVQLKYLFVEDCKAMEEILLLTEDLGDEEIITKVLFPCLEGLVLSDLPVLKRFCVGRNIIFRSLKQMVIEKCPKLETFIFKPVSSEEISHTAMQPLFNDKVAFPSLEKLAIVHVKNLKIIWNKDPQGTFSFQNLQKIVVRECESLKSLFPTSVARCLQQLNDLQIHECGIEEIIEQEEGAKEHARFVFPKLTLLILRQLPKLKWFYRGVHTSDWPLLKTLEVSGSNEIQIFASENYRIEESNEQSQLETSIQQPLFLVEEVAFPNLVSLSLSHMPNLEIIWHDKFAPGSFTKLQTMEVGECESLKSLFPTSVARCLQQLNDLRIYECGIEEIIEQEEGAKEDARFGFPKLTLLRLRKLSKLKWFYRGVHTSEWPLLKALEVSGSNEILIFASKNYRIQEQDEQIQLETSIQQPLFLVEEVAFPNLETLLISYMPNLKIIWHHKFAHGSFTKLQVMTVQFCGNLMKIFQVNMLSRFQSLETLVVEDCGSVQEIFELQGQEVTETPTITVTQLKKLIMHCLPKLKHVWNKDPEGTFSFPNLEQICAWECESLKSLFPTSVARCLKQLEDLLIVECGIEEIIEQEEGAKEDARFVFPKLTLLVLRQLPKLKWFYRGVHTSEWPLLKTLEVSGSNKIQIFASKEFRIEEPDEQSQLETSIQQPLFLVEEGTLFPNLEVLTLGGNLKMKEMQCDQLLEERFYKLKDLSIIGYLAVSDWINFLKRLHSLEKLFVKLTSWEEIFPYEQLYDQENNATILAQLRELELYKLPTLTHLWKEDTQPSPILYNLENLIVSFCDKLKILVPSSISFQNLTNLEILKCHGLINLVTSSTAKSLVQLKKMSLSECERITEVVVGEGGEASEVITFTQLIYLKLDSLPILASFCSESYSFNFPSLEEVIVRQCPKMKTFSYGALGTPKLKKVQSTQEDEWHWKVDLNTTIHCLTQ